MANQRTTFMKRQREQNKKDKQKAKELRLAARRAEARNLKDAPPGDDADAVGAPLDGTTSAPTSAAGDREPVADRSDVGQSDGSR